MFEELLPFVAYVRNARKLRRLAMAEDLLEQKPQYTGYRSLTPEQLLERLKEERARAASLDEKTFKITLSLTIGLTIIGTTSVILASATEAQMLKLIIGGTTWIAAFYILTAGFIAIGALKTETSFGYGTALLLISPEKKSDAYAEYLARQELMNQVRHVRNEASYQSLRNGMILLFVAFLVVGIGKIFERCLV
jgi:hypothetical protein